MTTAFTTLLSQEEICQKVQEMVEYQNLKKDAQHYLDPHRHPHEHGRLISNIFSQRTEACF
ncbi:hypothetical protein CY34DRAFT_803544 [Suillus luteus UH-Slu-Lm8-n1]|uniref:Uncharacterized protein n=1 Tax=Suillus luteus UH-Slu-Lm8-n1 TaxID=930992 RepID=A0A0D0A193_9AGAM|nr:hypothetical protein CY34DRAFT_803544 [Suillus luteus UH-Slu-Lm8-n1]